MPKRPSLAYEGPGHWLAQELPIGVGDALDGRDLGGKLGYVGQWGKTAARRPHRGRSGPSNAAMRARQMGLVVDIDPLGDLQGPLGGKGESQVLAVQRGDRHGDTDQPALIVEQSAAARSRRGGGRRPE